MNILIITNVLPFPLDSGGAQAQYNFIDRMRHDHHVTLLWIQTTSRRQQYIPSLQERWPEVEIISFSYRQQLLNPRFLCDKALRAFNLKCRPNSPRFQTQRVLKPYGLYASRPLIRFINNAIRQRAIDLVELNFYPCLQLAAHLPAALPKVFIHHELRYIRNERLLKNIPLTSAERLQQQAVKRQELADLARCNAVVTLTDIDRQLLLQEGVTVPVYTSPAAVMTEAKAMIKTEAQSAVKTKAQSTVKTKASHTTNSTASDNASSLSTDTDHWNGKITFLGGYVHNPNQEGVEWFLREVCPLIDWTAVSTKPDNNACSSTNPNNAANACSSTSSNHADNACSSANTNNADNACQAPALCPVISIVGTKWPDSYKSLVATPLVRLEGFVPDLYDAIGNSIMIVPILSGSGMRMKILEAAALGVPFVTTTCGVEGLDFRHEEACLVADSPQAFAQALTRLMTSPALRRQLSANAQHTYAARYSVEALYGIRANIYNKILS